MKKEISYVWIDFSKAHTLESPRKLEVERQSRRFSYIFIVKKVAKIRNAVID